MVLNLPVRVIRMVDSDPKAFESKWLAYWLDNKIYEFNQSDSSKPIFSVDTPPPTVSGEMHIGHACSYSQADFIVRYKRMCGFNVFYPFGTDDNGLPTERLVEKKKGIRAKVVGRAAFIPMCLDFLKEERPKFVQDWKNIGISCDFSLAYSTIDDHSRRIAQWSFLDLYQKKRLSRRDAPAMWCPECRTGVAQIEVQDQMMDSAFNDIVFKVGSQDLVIATTRPELLPACVAIFYNPSDERYKSLKGKMAQVPLMNFSVPIMEDIRALPDKGTGLVMCCTFGDQTDMEWQKAYQLPIKMIVNYDGKLNEEAGKYAGLSLKEARKQIIVDLKEANLLLKQVPIRHAVNVHERCGTEIEFIKSKQWFLNYLDLKADMLKWATELKWFPPHMVARYNNWVNGLQWDWLISNQRYFGVPFPLWYCKSCNETILPPISQLPVDPSVDQPPVSKCPSCNGTEFVPELDVLNTWFTSSLTPDIARKLLKKDWQDKVLPMDIRPQAHEIITFWLFTTMVKFRLHYDLNPWKNALISGFVTMNGEKMSKSKGNVIRPQTVIEQYGADAVRYWAASSRLGEDFDYQEKDVKTGKKFVIKILNVANLVFSSNPEVKKPVQLHPTDRLFLATLNRAVKNITTSFEEFNYAKAKQEVDMFFWHDLADNYLEIVKGRLYGTGDSKDSAVYTLYHSLLTVLKLMAPFTPFVTEELYQKYYQAKEGKKSIHLENWPVSFDILENETDESKWNSFLEVIRFVRQKKSDEQKSMKQKIDLTITKEEFSSLQDVLDDLKAVCQADNVTSGERTVVMKD